MYLPQENGETATATSEEVSIDSRKCMIWPLDWFLQNAFRMGRIMTKKTPTETSSETDQLLIKQVFYFQKKFTEFRPVPRSNPPGKLSPRSPMCTNAVDG